MRASLIGAGLVAVLMLAVTVARAGDVVFQDGDFAEADWETEVFTYGNGHDGTTVREEDGGNDGAYHKITLDIATAPPGSFSRVCVYNWNTTAVYDPAVQGAIESISYSEDGRTVSGTWCRTHLALRQNGQVFHSYGSDLALQFAGSVWTTQSWVAEDIDDFALEYSQEWVNPDFSEDGDPITFGYMRRQATTDVAYLTTTGIDNWSVAVTPVPEPATMSVLGILGLSLLRSRRT
jgi:hypothetical protein